MKTVRILLLIVAIASPAQVLAKHGIIPDLPKEYTMLGDKIVMLEDDSGNKMVVSYTKCPNSERIEVGWWRLGDTRARHIDCSGMLHDEDVRRAKWIVPAPKN